MSDDPSRTADPFAAFVVKTRVKPDGRRIHYYEWPEPGRQPAPRHEARPRDARDPAPTETGRV